MKKIFTLLTVLLMTTTIGAKQLYICGDKPAGNGWNFDEAAQIPLTLAADGITNTITFTVEGQVWFTITDGWGSNWDDYNANHRYGCSDFKAETGNYQLTQFQEATLTLTSGTYELSINSETMMLTLTANPATRPDEDSYYVVGSSNDVFGVSWNLEQSEPYMTKTGDGIFQWVKEGVVLTAGNIEWKVIVNPNFSAWGEQYGANGFGDNTTNVVTNIPEDGVYTLTFTLDLSAGNASVPTVTVEKTADAVIEKTYTVAGDWGLTGANWDPSNTDNDMVLNEITGLYEKTFHEVTLTAGEVYGLKVVENHAWGNKEYSDNGENFLVIPSETGIYDVTITLDLSTETLNAIVVAASGITSVKENQSAGILYNLAGLRVNANYKGVVVRNGKKVLVK